MAWASTDEARIDAVALDHDGARDSFAIGPTEPHQPPDWRSYLRGMTSCLADRGFAASGTRLAIAGSVPRGSGLSSSASLCIAVGRALAAAKGEEPLAPRELALAAQAAEHRWAGVHCGIMDQMAVAAGEPGHALLLDCRNFATRLVPLPPDWAVLIVDSGVSRGLVDGEYNQRRRACEAGAEALGIVSLREATLGQIEQSGLDSVVRRRVRHVVSEIARTVAAVEAIERSDLIALGQILRASHASLRDDFEVSVAPVDSLVDCLNIAIGTAGGARMTGGGFGGAVVAVVERAELERVIAAVRQGYRNPAGDVAAVLPV
jgi:galactokinase